MANNNQQKEPIRLDDLIDKKILDARRVFLSTMVDSTSAKEVIRRLWFLELSEPGKPITFIINSPGGSMDAGFAVWDQVKMLTSPITTLVTGLAASMGSLLSLCAPRGKRFATPNARFMIHQPSLSGVVQGQATDLSIQAKEILKMKSIIIDIYSEATKKSASEIEKMIDRDTWLGAKEALNIGLLDRIVSSYSEIE